jgi:Na+/proline symporter
MVIIALGMIYIAFVVSGIAGGAGTVIDHARAAGKFEFWPKPEAKEIIGFVAAWATMALGSIPQQDVFQRVSAAKNEQTAGLGSVLGGLIYFGFAFVPMFLAYSALLIDPKMVGDLIQKDSQYILPTLILNHAPFATQVIFFGALLAAILSCSSATLLAPSVTFAENILRAFFPRISDDQFLRMLRIVVFLFALSVLAFSLLSNSTIYGMVESAYKITLVAAFTPLAFGLYWKRATNQGAVFALAAGLGTWVALEIYNPTGFMPPQFAGLLAAMSGMIVGSLLPQRIVARAAHPQHRTV